MFHSVVPFSAVNAQMALNRSGSALKVVHDVQMPTMAVRFAAYALAWRVLGNAGPGVELVCCVGTLVRLYDERTDMVSVANRTSLYPVETLAINGVRRVQWVTHSEHPSGH